MKFKKSIYIFFTCISFTLILPISCVKKQNEKSPQRGDVKVIVSTPPQKEFAKEVLGESGKVTVMLPEGESPHTYEPTAYKMQKVAKADIYFKVGSGIYFEKKYMHKIIDVNPQLHIVDGSQGIATVPGDKHIWMSPQNAIVMVKNLLKELITLNPKRKNHYRQNATEYISKLEKLHKELKERFKPFHGEGFLIYHPSLAYFANSYGINQIAIQKQGKSPGTKELNRLIEMAKSKGIKTVFVSPQFDKSNAKIIAKNIGGSIEPVNALASDYLSNLKEIANKLLKSFTERGE